jgi:hypothetical protein
MALPNFICVGAERAGTTPLWRVLRQHPDVFMPEHKETHFFTRLFDRNPLVLYEAQYFGASRGHRAIGESTPEYMRFPEVPGLLRKALGPDLKLIFCLRDPIRRAFSQYHLRCRLLEENESFARALELEPQRIRANRYRGMRTAYVGGSLYARQIEYFLEVFPKESMFFMVLEEDLVKERARMVTRLCEFLDIRSDVPLDLDVRNTSNVAPRVVIVPQGETRTVSVRNRSEGITLQGEAVLFATGNKATDRILYSPSARAVAFFRRFAANVTRELPEAVAAVLYRDVFREEIGRVETLLGRDLTCWRTAWEELTAAHGAPSGAEPPAPATDR